MHQDALDRILKEWHQARPDLDPTPLAVLGRLQRLADLVHRRVDATLKPYGLTWELLDVLGTLRRTEFPFRCTPTALYRSCMLSSGAMTNRIDRLEAAGLVSRVPDPEDRRSILVGLTERGRVVVDEAIAVVWATLAQIVAGITATEHETLASLLRTLIIALEEPGPSAPAPTPPRPNAEDRPQPTSITSRTRTLERGLEP
jgi:DNA-binding MarR family transcriptional regulator